MRVSMPLRHLKVISDLSNSNVGLTSFYPASSSLSPEVLHQQQVQVRGAGELGGVAKPPQLVVIASSQHLSAAVHDYDSLTV